jgi:hypothetical protein
MEHTRFIGLDIHKERISIAVAESGRSGAVEYLGEVANDPGAISKLCDRLRRSGRPLAFCYEAGPCGYGVYRQLKSLTAQHCQVRFTPMIGHPQRSRSRSKSATFRTHAPQQTASRRRRRETSVRSARPTQDSFCSPTRPDFLRPAVVEPIACRNSSASSPPSDRR